MARRKRPSSGRPPASTPGTSPAMGKWSPPMVRAAVLGRRPQQRVCMPRGAQPGPACDNVAGARQPVAATPSKQRGLTERTSAFRSGEEASGSPVRSPAISRAHARTLVPSTGASSATGSAPGSGTGVPNSAHPRAPTERATSATLQSPLPADPAPLPSRPRPIGPAQKSHKARDFRTAPWREEDAAAEDHGVVWGHIRDIACGAAVNLEPSIPEPTRDHFRDPSGGSGATGEGDEHAEGAHDVLPMAFRGSSAT
jgi:hypothetical protein